MKRSVWVETPVPRTNSQTALYASDDLRSHALDIFFWSVEGLVVEALRKLQIHHAGLLIVHELGILGVRVSHASSGLRRGQIGLRTWAATRKGRKGCGAQIVEVGEEVGRQLVAEAEGLGAQTGEEGEEGRCWVEEAGEERGWLRVLGEQGREGTGGDWGRRRSSLRRGGSGAQGRGSATGEAGKKGGLARARGEKGERGAGEGIGDWRRPAMMGGRREKERKRGRTG